MSVAAELWNQILAGGNAIPPRKPPGRVSHWAPHSADTQELALVHQLFFPAVTLGRKAVLVASADEYTSASGLCERLAVTLSKFSGKRVVLAEDCASASPRPATFSAGSARSPWQAYATPISESVWRVPVAFACDGRSRREELKRDDLNGLRTAFDYFLFSATVADSHIPVLCGLCDAAVLLLTANLTRRDAAVRAREQLLLQRVNFLGAILDQRTFPIPESIYQYL